MKKFLVRLISVLGPVTVLPIIVYIIVDPLYVIWNYDYTKVDETNAAYKAYKIMTKDGGIPYNSFIVGASCSQMWSWQDWETHLDITARAFHLNQSSDGVAWSLERLQYVYRNVEEVKNVLLIIDEKWLEKTKTSEEFHARSPWQMIGVKDFIPFHVSAFKYFFSNSGITHFFHIGDEYKLSPHNLPSYYDERAEPHYIGKDWAIVCDPNYYYTNLALQNVERFTLYQRDGIEKIAKPVISNECRQQLEHIHQLFIDGHTDYKIVISPLYNQIKLNPADKAILDSIFGERNVFDYSGINNYTNEKTNYYEALHYRPHVATAIMKEIYE